MSQFRSFLEGETKREFPENLEESRRKNTYPATCSESCPHRTCGYHTQENYGKPCQMLWEPQENKKMEPTSQPNPNEQLLRTVERLTEAILEKHLAPLIKRLEAIENQADYHALQNPMNGEHPPIQYRESLRGDTIHD